MEENNSEKYLSLKTAAQMYGYTRDHLGLMIRQNKLKGTKLGSYYVTTNGWMTDYIKNFANPSRPASRGKLSNKFLTEILSSKKDLSPVVSAKNTAKTITPKNTPNNAVKEYTADNDLKEKILKELAQYKSLIDGKAPKANINQTESVILMSSVAPYIILPIRKMENIEREEILRKTE